MRGAPFESPGPPPNWPGASGISGSTYGNENGTAIGPWLAIGSRRTPHAAAPRATVSPAEKTHDPRRRCSTSRVLGLKAVLNALQAGTGVAARSVLRGHGGPLRIGVLDQPRGARRVR